LALYPDKQAQNAAPGLAMRDLRIHHTSVEVQREDT
jgi:hypothetical protein